MINLGQYKKICIACDKILHIASDKDEIISIPILHVIREHPEFLEKYNFIYSKTNSVRIKSEKIFNKLFNQIKSTFFDYKIHNNPYHFDQYSRRLIIVSHITNPIQCNNIDDEYFGTLHNDLLKFSNIKPILVLINQTSVSSKKLSKDFTLNNIDRIVLPKSSGLYNEFKIFIKLILSVYSFTRAVKIDDSIVSSLVKAISKPSHFLKSMSILRNGFFIEKIVKENNAKYIINTYEGHASERIMFSRARKANDKILCFAYQHSILNKYHHALTRIIHKKYNPDHIFCCGNITNKILSKSESLNGTEISVLGSPKGNTKNEGSKKMWSTKSLTFLFLPEASNNEYTIFFRFILKCSIAFPDYRFIWRSHPALNLQKLDLVQKVILPSNIIISTNTFDNDLKASDVAIYRGTTAIIKAVMSNLIPIYLKTKDEIGIDIMHNLNISRIDSTSELHSSIQNPNLLKDKESNLKFCEEYFRPLNYKSFVLVANQYSS
jgi:hypothetical protein